MLSNYVNFQFDVQGKPVKGFCMKIHDEFHETYAVVMDGYHSFCVWLDQPSSTWKSSKYVNVEPGVLEKIISYLNMETATA
ncbi:hypothetical protein ACSBL2_10295 [Pedobacter sp. AW31-3R]|uniref:hypothetical protein n=1 Tax=Pedobacter sp. AW31-3R TaxID=3445781 RepID=UPI003FA014C6